MDTCLGSDDLIRELLGEAMGLEVFGTSLGNKIRPV